MRLDCFFRQVQPTQELLEAGIVTEGAFLSHSSTAKLSYSRFWNSANQFSTSRIVAWSPWSTGSITTNF